MQGLPDCWLQSGSVNFVEREGKKKKSSGYQRYLGGTLDQFLHFRGFSSPILIPSNPRFALYFCPSYFSEATIESKQIS